MDESVLTLSFRAFNSVSSWDRPPSHPSASCKVKRSVHYSIYFKSTRSIRLLTSSSLTASPTFSRGKSLPNVTWEVLARTSATALLGASSTLPTVFTVFWEFKGRTCYLFTLRANKKMPFPTRCYKLTCRGLRRLFIIASLRKLFAFSSF